MLDERPLRTGASWSRLALICPAGIGRQKNFLVKVLPLLLLGPWGKRKIRKLVFGPAPKILPKELLLLAELMDAVARIEEGYHFLPGLAQRIMEFLGRAADICGNEAHGPSASPVRHRLGPP